MNLFEAFADADGPVLEHRIRSQNEWKFPFIFINEFSLSVKFGKFLVVID